MSWAYRNPPAPTPTKEPTLDDFTELLPEHHRSFDPYIGVTHKAVAWVKRPNRYVYAVTCSCGAVIEVSGMVVP